MRTIHLNFDVEGLSSDMARMVSKIISFPPSGFHTAVAVNAKTGNTYPNAFFKASSSGLLATAGSTLLNLRHEAKHPEMARQHDIEQKDERNVAIRNRAKAVSGEALQWSVLAAAWLSIGLDAPLWVPLAATGVFVAKSILELYLMVRYEREM